MANNMQKAANTPSAQRRRQLNTGKCATEPPRMCQKWGWHRPRLWSVSWIRTPRISFHAIFEGLMSWSFYWNPQNNGCAVGGFACTAEHSAAQRPRYFPTPTGMHGLAHGNHWSWRNFHVFILVNLEKKEISAEESNPSDGSWLPFWSRIMILCGLWNLKNDKNRSTLHLQNN